jgi:predicted dehydrogenase
LARAALEAGKHVVIDKPFASTSEEARTLIELATSLGLVVAPFHNRRWDGDYLTLKKIIAGGTLGRIVMLESHFDRFRPLQREGTWKETPGPINGLLMDLAPHILDQALDLFGTPRTITASVRRDRDVTQIEDAWDITLEFDRVRALCRSTMLAAEPAPRFLLHGTRGSFRKLGVDPQEPALLAGAEVPPMGSDQPWLPEDASAWGETVVAPDPARPGDLVRTTIPTEPGDYRPFYASVRDAVLGVAPLAVPPEAGYRILKLIELARESSATGRTLPVVF